MVSRGVSSECSVAHGEEKAGQARCGSICSTGRIRTAPKISGSTRTGCCHAPLATSVHMSIAYI